MEIKIKAFNQLKPLDNLEIIPETCRKEIKLVDNQSINNRYIRKKRNHT